MRTQSEPFIPKLGLCCACYAAFVGTLQLSLRLERMGLTDREAGMLADWACRAGPTVTLRKLWL